jgi:hypothetical protein
MLSAVVCAGQIAWRKQFLFPDAQEMIEILLQQVKE